MAIVSDITISTEGDLVLSVEPYTLKNDLDVSTRQDIIRQQVIMRIKTYQGDWLDYPQLGANIDDYIGIPNTRQNVEMIANKIKNALTYDGFMNSSSVSIYSIPVNDEEVLFTIRIAYGKDTLTFPISYSLKEGIREGDISNW